MSSVGAHFQREGQIGCIHGHPGFCWRCEELRILVEAMRGNCGCKPAAVEAVAKRGPGRPRKNADA